MILHGDCRTELAKLPDASVDSIVTDPPYELGFMGKQWDSSGIAYDPHVWAECLRVLKPGGHLCAFGGTRTYHRMVVAIEDAGFEIRDSIHWLYGSGFPKSLDVSKAMDKAAGAQRPVVGTGPAHCEYTSRGEPCEGHDDRNGRYGETVHALATAPATDAAQQWTGWGTALKPAHEPIVLARKPLMGTVASNVLAHGTGALNIDATRVGANEGTTKGTFPKGASNGIYGDSLNGACEIVNLAAGRWPANLVLTHSPECEQVGTTPDTFGGGAKATSGFVDGYEHDGFKGQTVDVPVWRCVAGCPVATLNEQSGERPAGMYPKQRGEAVATAFSKGRPTEGGLRSMGDSGGAARYFTTTEWHPNIDAPFLYVAKPSRKERNAGLDGMKPQTNIYGMRPAIPEHGDRPGSVNDKFQTRPAANHHPTVKPVALMRHLIKLVTPPGGTVLDPFLGSGTTAVAATLEGFTWVGCELTADYLPIIQARVAWAISNAQPATYQLTLEDAPE